MKKVIFGALAIALVSIGACNKAENSPVPPITNIGESANDLLFLREEEKLARDVYMFAAQLYATTPIFANIASSEQKHMDKTLVLLQQYGLADPAAGKAAGEFLDSNLQALYNQLTEKASLGLADALWVGATVEDLDLSDLQNMLLAAEITPEMIALYSQLSCGSRNHLRAFTSQLELQGQRYTPQYLSLEQYDAILAGSHENCNQP